MHPRLKRVILPVVLVAVQMFGLSRLHAEDRPEDLLVRLIIARLDLAREVAWSKFSRHAKVSDPEREARVLAGMRSEGEKLGIPGDQVFLLFKPQIIASCRLQEELIAGWASDSIPRPLTPAKDLQREIRPDLDKVDAALLRVWRVLSGKAWDRADFYAALGMIEQRGFSADVAKIAARPLAPSSGK
jgi:chorismate mutase-like protein